MAQRRQIHHNRKEIAPHKHDPHGDLRGIPRLNHGAERTKAAPRALRKAVEILPKRRLLVPSGE